MLPDAHPGAAPTTADLPGAVACEAAADDGEAVAPEPHDPSNRAAPTRSVPSPFCRSINEFPPLGRRYSSARTVGDGRQRSQPRSTAASWTVKSRLTRPAVDEAVTLISRD